jgi:hypothetical protein
MNDMSEQETPELVLSTDVDPEEPVKKTWENTKPRVQIVQETNIGVYVWQLPDGNFLTDDDANFLSIASRQGDKERIRRLQEAAAHHGYPDGFAVFYAGSRKISENEFWHQVERMMDGYVPDPYDVPALMGEIEARQSGLGY